MLFLLLQPSNVCRSIDWGDVQIDEKRILASHTQTFKRSQNSVQNKTLYLNIQIPYVICLLAGALFIL